MTVIGEAYVEIKPESSRFGPEAESGVLASVGSIAKKAAGILGGAFVVKEAFDFGRQIFSAAEEANKGLAQTEAALKSTGGAAGVTSDEITDLTDTLSAHNTVEDDAIRKGENLLLTFTNVQNRAGDGNDIFNQSTQAMIDLAAAMGTDVSGGAIQLGKALNDPVDGISALTRVGVTFTDQQKKQIETMVEAGNVAGAQKIILAELNKEFGGSAAAQATTADKARLAWGEFQEALGNKLMPVAEHVFGFLADKAPAALDVASRVIDRVVGGLSGLFDLVVKGDFSGAFAKAFGMEEDAPIVNLVLNLRERLLALWQFLNDNVVPILQVALKVALDVIAEVLPRVVSGVDLLSGAFGNPVFQIVAAIIATALVPALIALGVNATIAGAQAVAAWLLMEAQAIASAATQVAQLVIMGAKYIWLGITALASAAQVALSWLIALGPLALLVAAVVGAALLIVNNWDWIKETVGNVVGAIGGFLSWLIDKVVGFVERWGFLLLGPIGMIWHFRDEIWDAVQAVIRFFGDLLSGAKDKLGDLIGWVKGVPGKILDALGNVGNILWDAGWKIMLGLKDGIVAGLGAVLDFVTGIAGKIIAKKGPPDYDKRMLVPAGRAIMDSLEQGMADRQARVEARLRALTASIASVGPDSRPTGRTGATTGPEGAPGVPAALLAEIRALVAAVALLAANGGGSGSWTLNGTDPVAVGAVVERSLNWGAAG